MSENKWLLMNKSAIKNDNNRTLKMKKKIVIIQHLQMNQIETLNNP